MYDLASVKAWLGVTAATWDAFDGLTPSGVRGYTVADVRGLLKTDDS